MIRALFLGKTAENSDANFAKIVLDAKLRIESFSFQFGFDIFNRDVVDYVKEMDRRITLKNSVGDRIAGNGWVQLSDADILFMHNNAIATAQNNYDYRKRMSGEYARMVWSKVMYHLRKTKELDFDFHEQTFEQIFKIENGTLSLLDSSIEYPAYVATGLPVSTLGTYEVLQSVKITNSTDTEQVMSVALDGNEFTYTVPANSSVFDRLNIKPAQQSTISVTGTGVFEFISKCDDNTAVTPVIE